MSRSWIAWLALGGLAAAGTAEAQVVLSGRVVDQNEAPVANARVLAKRGPEVAGESFTSPSGGFEMRLPAPGDYRLDVDRAGYFALKDRPVAVSGSGAEMTLLINQQQEVFQSITVGEQPTPIDPQQTEHEQRLSGTEINDIPYPASHSLRNSMKLIPGVLQDATGGLHFHGGAENQTQYTWTDSISPTRLTAATVRCSRWKECGRRRSSKRASRPSMAGGRRARWRFTPKPEPTSYDTPPPISFPGWTPAAGCTSEIGLREPVSRDRW